MPLVSQLPMQLLPLPSPSAARPARFGAQPLQKVVNKPLCFWRCANVQTNVLLHLRRATELQQIAHHPVNCIVRHVQAQQAFSAETLKRRFIRMLTICYSSRIRPAMLLLLRFLCLMRRSCLLVLLLILLMHRHRRNLIAAMLCTLCSLLRMRLPKGLMLLILLLLLSHICLALHSPCSCCPRTRRLCRRVHALLRTPVLLSSLRFFLFLLDIAQALCISSAGRAVLQLLLLHWRWLLRRHEPWMPG